MTSVTTRNKYDILKKYKTQTEKQLAIDHFIDIINNESATPDKISEAKEESVILAESLLRCEKKKPKKSANN
jgi:hypothetical protein